MTSSLPATGLAGGQLRIREPPATVGAGPGAVLAQISLQFNPNKLALTKSTEWRRKPSRMASPSATPEFVGSGPRSMSVEGVLGAPAQPHNTGEQKGGQPILG